MLTLADEVLEQLGFLDELRASDLFRFLHHLSGYHLPYKLDCNFLVGLDIYREEDLSEGAATDFLAHAETACNANLVLGIIEVLIRHVDSRCESYRGR
jgi:hypothetical protein